MEITLIIALNLIVYFRKIYYTYVIDDQYVPKKRGKNPIHTAWLRLRGKAYSNPQAEHLLFLCVHIIVCVLIYIAFGKNQVSFLTALLFSVNPSNNQVTIWLNGVGYSMSAIFVMLMYIFPAYAIIPYVLSLWWHVTAFPAPLLFLGSYNVLLLPVYIIILYLTKFKVPFGKFQDNATMNHRLKEASKEMVGIFADKLVFVVKVYAYYFFLGLFPRRLGLYHTFGYAFGISKMDTFIWTRKTPLFWWGLVLIFTNVYLMITFWNTPLGFGLFWFTIFIAQWCNLVLLHQTIASRYVYLPNIGLMYAVSWTLLKIGGYLEQIF